MSDLNDPTRAVVLSGGGANGAYEVGILKALFAGKSPATRGRPLEPDVFVGTSIGSFNASFLVSHWDRLGSAVAGDLERTWLEVLAGTAGRNGGIRFRFDPSYYLNPRTYMDAPLHPFAQFTTDVATVSWDTVQRLVHLVSATDEGLRDRLAGLFNFASFISRDPWEQTIESSISFETIRTTRRKLRVVATNWATGELEVFWNQDMTDKLGPQAILASSAIPGVFSPVFVGAEPYVDGGVLMNTPLRQALDEDATELHVIYLDPKVASIPLDSLNSTVASNYRLQTISWAQMVNDDIEDAGKINRGLQILHNIGQGIDPSDKDLEHLARGMSKLVPRLKSYLRFKPLTIHRYHPTDELGGGPLGLLNLARGHIQELIERGFADAVLHNCEDSKCILPDAPQGDLATIPAAMPARA